MSFNPSSVWQPLYRLIWLALWLLLLCIILFTVRNLNNGNMGEKKRVCLLGRSGGGSLFTSNNLVVFRGQKSLGITAIGGL